jgi:hypothetical protein
MTEKVNKINDPIGGTITGRAPSLSSIDQNGINNQNIKNIKETAKGYLPKSHEASVKI